MPGYNLERPQLPSLTGIRFFAAMHVVLYHVGQLAYSIAHSPAQDTASIAPWAASVWAIFDSHWMLRGFLKGAVVEVGLFFVLSGFILTYMHRPERGQSRFDTRGYIVSRFARIYPMYLIGLIMALPIFWFVVMSPDSPVSTGKAIGAAVSVPLLMHAWWPPISIFPWNPPAWSLSVEAFCYLVLPLIIIPSSQWSVTRLVVFSLGCWIACLVPPAAYIVLDPEGVGSAVWTVSQPLFWLDLVRHNPICRLPEFLLGVAAGQFAAQRAASNARSGIKSGAWISTSAFLAVGIVLLFSEHIHYLLLHNGLLAPLFAIAVAGLALGGGPFDVLFRQRPIAALGDSAYGIYMLHYPMLLYSIFFMKIDWEQKGKAPPEPWWFLVSFSFMVILNAFLTHRSLELKARRWMRRLLEWLIPKQNPDASLDPTTEPATMTPLPEIKVAPCAVVVSQTSLKTAAPQPAEVSQVS